MSIEDIGAITDAESKKPFDCAAFEAKRTKARSMGASGCLLFGLACLLGLIATTIDPKALPHLAVIAGFIMIVIVGAIGNIMIVKADNILRRKTKK